MQIILLGLNHKTAPLEVREKLSLSWDRDTDPLTVIAAMPGVREACYLSTCNRVEVIAVIEGGDEHSRGLKELLLCHGNLAREELERCLYLCRGVEAVAHLFRVASSLDSMIVGETQILGQVKDAYRRSVQSKTTGTVLNKLLHQAFRVAKRVRTETAIAQNALSISHVAVTLAKKIFGILKGKKVLLVGAGEMSELAAKQLVKNGVDKVLIINRTFARAVELAGQIQGEALDWQDLSLALTEADIVITSTGSPDLVISAAMLAATLRERKNRLLFLIDIAVPRDVDPQAGELENVFLYNIDNLQEIADENHLRRQAEAQKAQVIIEEELIRYLTWMDSLEVVPVINQLRAKFEGAMENELGRHSHWLNGLGPENRKQVEMLLSGVIGKLLHDPITSLKEHSGTNGGYLQVAALRRLFRLEGERGELPELPVEDEPEGNVACRKHRAGSEGMIRKERKNT